MDGEVRRDSLLKNGETVFLGVYDIFLSILNT